MNIRKNAVNNFRSFAAGRTIVPQNRSPSRSRKFPKFKERIIVRNYYKDSETEMSSLDITIPRAKKFQRPKRVVEDNSKRYTYIFREEHSLLKTSPGCEQEYFAGAKGYF